MTLFLSNLTQILVRYAIYLVAGFQCHIRAISEAAAEPAISKRDHEEKLTQSWKIKMLYDGDCPLCMREVYLENFISPSSVTLYLFDINSFE